MFWLLTWWFTCVAWRRRTLFRLFAWTTALCGRAFRSSLNRPPQVPLPTFSPFSAVAALHSSFQASIYLTCFLFSFSSPLLFIHIRWIFIPCGHCSRRLVSQILSIFSTPLCHGLYSVAWAITPRTVSTVADSHFASLCISFDFFAITPIHDLV